MVGGFNAFALPIVVTHPEKNHMDKTVYLYSSNVNEDQTSKVKTNYSSFNLVRIMSVSILRFI
jgi:hypothetical protein